MSYSICEYLIENGTLILVVNNAMFQPVIEGYLYKASYDHGFSSSVSFDANTIITPDMIPREFIMEEHVLELLENLHDQTILFKQYDSDTDPFEDKYYSNDLSGTITNNISVDDLYTYYKDNGYDDLKEILGKHLRQGLEFDERISYKLDLSAIRTYVIYPEFDI